jgi:hypothetical protein
VDYPPVAQTDMTRNNGRLPPRQSRDGAAGIRARGDRLAEACLDGTKSPKVKYQPFRLGGVGATTVVSEDPDIMNGPRAARRDHGRISDTEAVQRLSLLNGMQQFTRVAPGFQGGTRRADGGGTRRGDEIKSISARTRRHSRAQLNQPELQPCRRMATARASPTEVAASIRAPRAACGPAKFDGNDRPTSS